MPIKPIPPGQGFEQLTEAVATEYGAVIELVRQAVRERVRMTPGASDYYVDVSGIFPDRIVVRLNGRLQSYPYTLGADNTVTLGDPAEVVLAYAAVRDAAVREAVAAAASGTGTFTEAADGSIAVTLICAGPSINGNYYPDAALQAAVPLFEGVRVFAKSDGEHVKGGGKDVRNLLGGIYSVAFKAGATPDTGRLVGTFKAIDPTEAAVVKMVEAVRRGMQSLMGLSIDATARTRNDKQGNKTVRTAVQFVKVNSVDLIVEPGAGGGLDRLTEAAAIDDIPPEQHGETMLKQRLYEAIKAKDATRAAGIDVLKITDDELMAVYEAVFGPAATTPPKADDPTRLAEAADNAPVTRAELAMHNARGYATLAIAGSTLPQVAKDKLQAHFKAAERFTEAAVDQAIVAEREYLARFSESGRPNGGLGRIEVQDKGLQVAEMFDAFFDPKHKNHRDVQSFKECYIAVTGDRRVTGRMEDCDQGLMRESLGRFSEAVSSSTFANALGDSITRRLIAAYIGETDLQAWRQVCIWGPVSDFRSQQRMRIGGYGNLPAVAQGAAYATLTSPSDLAANYAVTKRGGLETVTLEAIKNDDVMAIRRIPSEMALAAANTLYEFVFDFYRTNPTIYDAAALYTGGRGNLFTVALSAAEYSAHRLSMAKLTRLSSAKRRGVTPSRVLVPFDLQETAYNLFVRGQNLDKTFVQTINPMVIPVAYWTDVNDWVTLADPNVAPVIELGFLDGKEEPEVFVQDNPSVGSLFSNDQVTYKIRHIYGGAVLPEGDKFTTKAVVP